MRRRKLFRGAIVGLIVAATMIAGPSGTADVADEETTVSSFFLVGMDVEAAKSGKLSVEMDWSFSFAGDHNDTFHLAFPEEQGIAGDSGGLRHTPITGISGGSADGNAVVSVERSDASVSVRFEDTHAGREVLHDYHLDYETAGVVESGAGTGGEDVLSWKIFDGDFEYSMDTVDINFAGPGKVLTAECRVEGRGAGEECGLAEFEGRNVLFRERWLSPGEGLTVAVTFEPGTFHAHDQSTAVRRSTWMLIAGGSLLTLVVGIAITAGSLSLRAKSRGGSRLP